MRLYFLTENLWGDIFERSCWSWKSPSNRLSHKLLGNFSAAFKILGNFCDFRQLLKFLASFGLNYFFTFFATFISYRKKRHLKSTGLYYWVSVWTPGLAQLPMPAWCCTPVHEVSGITWSVLQNGGQQCPAGKNVPGDQFNCWIWVLLINEAFFKKGNTNKTYLYCARSKPQQKPTLSTNK